MKADGSSVAGGNPGRLHECQIPSPILHLVSRAERIRARPGIRTGHREPAICSDPPTMRQTVRGDDARPNHLANRPPILCNATSRSHAIPVLAHCARYPDSNLIDAIARLSTNRN